MIRAAGPKRELVRSDVFAPKVAPDWRGTKTGWVACILFLAITLPITWYSRGERSAWCKINFPGDRWSYINLTSYNYLLGSDPVMQENEPFVGHVAFLSGLKGYEASSNGKASFEWRRSRPFGKIPTTAPPPKDPYAIRVYYGFFATLLTPFLGIIRAMLVVNWLAWALCGWVAWRLSKKLFNDDLAALFTVIFVAGGMGMISHIADYSAHLLSFASYYLGVFLLYRSGILFARKSPRTHLMLGAYLAVACLVYGNGIVLTALYILAAWRHNSFRNIAGATLFALTARPLWRITLGLFGIEGPDIEGNQLIGALHNWKKMFQQPFPITLEAIVGWLGECGLFDSPVVVVLGLFSCFLIRQRSVVPWFGVAVMGLGFGAWLVALDAKSGYQVYGISVWIYCWLGKLLARGLRRPGWGRLTMGGVLILAVSSHFAWSTAYMWNGLGPLKLYIAGWSCGLQHLLHPTAQVVSMTGAEETPVLFGGHASLAEAGAWIKEREFEIDHSRVSFSAAFTRRFLPFAYLGIFAAASTRLVPRRLLIGGLMLAGSLLSSGLTWATFRTLPVFNYFDEMIMPPGGKLTYRVTLSLSFLTKLKGGIEQNDTLYFFLLEGLPEDLGLEPPQADVSIMAGSIPIPAEERGWSKRFLVTVCDMPLAVDALNDAGELTVVMVNRTDRPLTVTGWQRRGLPGRDLILDWQKNSLGGEPPILPSVEIRLGREDHSLKLIGF